MRKNIDISTEAVKAITIQAIHEGTVFKLKAEQVLEDYAKNLTALPKGGAKSFNKKGSKRRPLR